MRNFILRLFINAFTLTIVAMLLPGIHFGDNSIGTLVIVALIFGLANAVLKPIILILSCSLILLTFGLWILVVNGLILIITAELAGSRFQVDTIWWAILAGVIVGIIGGIMENVLGLNDKDDDDDDRKIRIISQ
ncbi:MAG: phage holin family protein [Anaerolineae bacterium]|nr:phage holin family protein [Anaerolineae bacterium]